jgi:hypothetical protein
VLDFLVVVGNKIVDTIFQGGIGKDITSFGQVSIIQS